MSKRSRLLNAGLRRFAKSHEVLSGEELVRRTRASLTRAGEARVPVPAFVRFDKTEIGGVPAEWGITEVSDPSRVVIFTHGGSYIGGSPSSHRNLFWRLSHQGRCRVLALDYRLAPEHPYPAGIEDLLAAHQALLGRDDVKRIAWAGDSAGAGLALAALHAAEQRGIPVPCSLVAISPWCDLACSGQSWSGNAVLDPWLTPEGLRVAAGLYLNGEPGTDPGPSAAYADFKAPPPTLIQVGDSEVLLDDSRKVAERLRAAGGEVLLQEWRDVPHVWHLFAPLIPEARKAMRRVGRFLRSHW